MKFVITDENKKEVLFTTTIFKAAYEYLQTIVPERCLPSTTQLRNAFNYDKSKEEKVDSRPFGFENNEGKILWIMDVYYNE
jgi:hypothetical protein